MSAYFLNVLQAGVVYEPESSEPVNHEPVTLPRLRRLH
jgi:hypothetical protein